MMRFSFISLGCPKNLVDSERIIGQLGQEGMGLTDDRNDAQCVILNTCGFIKPAIDESMQAIQRLLEWKKKRKSRRILVCGCLVNRMKSHLCRRFPQVDGWFEIEKEGEIASALGRGKPGILPEARLLTTPKHYAYLKIAEGCDNRCTYCTIPEIRGSLRSRKIESITGEAQALADMGVKELILVAQDTTNYGYDLYKKRRLVDLIKKISRIDGIRWIRLLYTHPAHIDQPLIEEIGSNPRVCKYVDMPIQHINNRILKLMNRKYERKTVERLIDELRVIPGLVIRTTIMAGFPTETSGEFDELLGFVRAVSFDHAGFFPYYREEGTAAADLPQIPQNERTERMRSLAQVQFENVKASNQKSIGREIVMVVDRMAKRFAFGRSEHEAPEVDRRICIQGNTLRVGQLYRARITNTRRYDLVAKIVGAV